MLPVQVIWDLPDEQGGNVQHIAEHGLTVADVEAVLLDDGNPTVTGTRKDRRVTFGRTPDGRHIAVVWDEVAVDVVRPVTAFEVPERWRNV